jgi:hypothetical protein
MGLVIHAHLSYEAKGKTLGFSYGPRQRKLRGQVFSLGHRVDLEAKAAPLAEPLELFKGEGRAGACSSPNPSRRPNCCPPHLSLATAHRQSPAAEILHHKHHAVVLLIQSITPPYLAGPRRRIRCHDVRVQRSEAPPVVALGSDQIARRRR